MKPQDTQRFRRNEYYKSAMHAAVEYPGLAMLMCEGSKAAAQKVEGTDSPMPGVKQVMRLLTGLGLASTVMHTWVLQGTDIAENYLRRGSSNIVQALLDTALLYTSLSTDLCPLSASNICPASLAKQWWPPFAAFHSTAAPREEDVMAAIKFESLLINADALRGDPAQGRRCHDSEAADHHSQRSAHPGGTQGDYSQT